MFLCAGQSVGAPFESATIRPIDSSIFLAYEVVSCKGSWDHVGKMRVFMMTKIDLECSESYSCVTTHLLCVVHLFFDIILAFRSKIGLAVSAAALINAGSDF